MAAGTVVATVAPEHVALGRRTAFHKRASALARRGVAVWFLPRAKGIASGVDLQVLLARFAAEERHDVLVEGGATLGSSLAGDGLVDELWLFVAPLLLGGRAPAWRFGEMPTALADAWRLDDAVVVALGGDWVVHGRPVKSKAPRKRATKRK